MKPVRTCVACGRKGAKDTLSRFVWGGEEPERDKTGTKPGRGAYCCDETCTARFFTQRKKWKRVFRLY